MNRIQKIARAAKKAVLKAFTNRKHAPVGTHAPSRTEHDHHWDLDRVRQALAEHERGVFTESSLLVDYIRRDPRAFSTVESRVLASVGGKRTIEPASGLDVTNAELARAIAEDVKSWWWEFIPESAQGDLIRWAVLMGFAVGELSYRRKDRHSDRVYPTMTVHHPSAVRHDRQTGKWYLLRASGGEIQISPGDGRWVLFTLGGGQTPWMQGAIRAIALPWYTLACVVTDWARREEIEATGIRVAKVPANAKSEHIRKFLKQIANLGRETALTLPDGYSFDFVTVDTGAADGFQRLADRCDTSITLVLLGQNLTTSIEGGSYAAAQTHARVQLERVKADVNALGTVLREQVLKPWGAINFEFWIVAYTPWPLFDTSPPEDKQKSAQAILTLSQAVKALADAGADVIALLEDFGVETVEGEMILANIVRRNILELFAAGIITANEARQALGWPLSDWGNGK